MYTQTEKVNIEPKSYLPVFRISQNDVGRTLKAHLVSDEGTIAIPAGATVTMAGIKPSGLGYTVTGTINGSDVTFETDATMTDEAGQIESEIRIVDGETLIGTTNVVLNVEPNPHPDDTTDGQREPLVNEITALLNQITAQADRVEEYSSKVLNMTVSAHESQEPTVTKTEGEVVNLDFGLPRGEKGERGERGERGEAGKDGKDGLDGKDGKDGKDGINGVTPDFSIGTVTTLEPNESASVTLTGTEEEPVLNFGIPRGVKGEQGEVSLSDLEKIMVTDTASGAIASFPDGSDLLPALSLVANIVPKQSGSGTPSPDNVREISGWESVETVVSGKNLWDTTRSDLMHGYYETDGTWYHHIGFDCLSFKCSEGMVFTKSGTGWGGIVTFWNGDTFVTAKNNTTVTTPSGANIAKFAHQNQYNDAQLETGTTATAYEPYTATTHTTSLGRTVYGGTVDVVKGTLTVDKIMAIFDGSEDWQRYPTGSASAYAMSTAITTGRPKANARPLCNYADGLLTSDTYGEHDCFVSTSDLIRWVAGKRDITTVADWKAYLAQNPLQVCYELATPTTYTLTPQTINTLQGVNNVWVDSGDCSITYYADTKLYIDKKLGGN